MDLEHISEITFELRKISGLLKEIKESVEELKNEQKVRDNTAEDKE